MDAYGRAATPTVVLEFESVAHAWYESAAPRAPAGFLMAPRRGRPSRLGEKNSTR